MMRPNSPPVNPKKYRLAYGEITDLAVRVGCTPSHMSRVLSGERHSAKLIAEIESILGVRLHEIELPRRRERAA